jgi:hypothetical protein
MYHLPVKHVYIRLVSCLQLLVPFSGRFYPLHTLVIVFKYVGFACPDHIKCRHAS